MEYKVKLKNGEWLPNNYKTKNAYEKFRKQQRLKIKRKKRKEKIMTGVIIAFIILVFLLIMNWFDSSYKKDIENCMNAGHSRYYCEKGM